MVLRFLLFFLLPLSVYAFKYNINPTTISNPSLLNALELNERLNEEGVHLVRSSPMTTIKPFDFVFTSQDWSKALLLKEGLEAPKEYLNKWIKQDDIFIYHFTFQNSHYLLISLGFSQEELNRLLAKVVPNQQANIYWDLFLNRAHANTCRLETANTKLKNAFTQLEQAEYFRRIGKCTADAVQSAQQSLGDTYNFFNALISHPEKLWNKMKDSFLELKEFVIGIKVELEIAFKSLAPLPMDQKLQIACAVAGEMVLQLQTKGTIVKAIPIVILKIKKISKLLANVLRLKNQGYKLPNYDKITEELLSCAK